MFLTDIDLKNIDHQKLVDPVKLQWSTSYGKHFKNSIKPLAATESDKKILTVLTNIIFNCYKRYIKFAIGSTLVSMHLQIIYAENDFICFKLLVGRQVPG